MYLFFITCANRVLQYTAGSSLSSFFLILLEAKRWMIAKLDLVSMY